MGLRNERLLQQLLTQDHNRPLDNLFQFALTVKAAENESFRLQRTSQLVTLQHPPLQQ